MSYDNVTVIRKDDPAPQRKEGVEPYGFVKYPLVPKYGGNRCCLSLYELPPGKSSYPYHYHERVDEVFYILCGRGLLETPEGVREVGPGDTVFCPPGESGAHRLSNASHSEPLRYLDFDTVDFPDVAVYPHTGKVAVLRGDESLFFPRDAAVPYYQNEPDEALRELSGGGAAR